MVSDFNKKGNREAFNNDLLFKTVGILLLIFVAFMIVEDIKIYQKKRELATEINNYKKQITDIKNSSQTLKDEIANSNNTDYLEKLGYEQFGETKPGETEYMFVKSAKKDETISNSKSQNLWDPKLWLADLGQFWSWIKDNF